MSQLMSTCDARRRDSIADSRAGIMPAFTDSVTDRLRHRTLHTLPDARQRGDAGFSAGSAVYTLKAAQCMVFHGRLPHLDVVEPRADYLLARHLDGDWGDAPQDVVNANRLALEARIGRVTSVYLMDTRQAPYVPGEWTPMIVMTELQGGSTVFFIEQDLLAR